MAPARSIPKVDMDHPVRTPKSVYLTLGAGFGLGAVCMAGVLSGRVPVASTAQAQSTVGAPHIAVGKPTLAGATVDGLPELKSLDNSFRTLAREVGPAVVDIRAGRGGGDGKVVVSEGEGSGFLVSGDGWIVTNDHVVDGAKTVTVTLKDGRTFEGKVTPSNDETSDIAVVKIEAKSLPYLTFADSSNVEPGEFAMAVGAPFGLKNSVTIGHVSALARDSQIGAQGKMRMYADLIQTDAAINMGNSGGPLVNVDGQVIGMNTAIYSPTGGSNGIGFAIPSNQVRLIADLLMTKGKLTRSMISLVPEDVKEYERTGLLKDGGARVFKLVEGPAKNAGLKEGDVIVKIGDRPIRSQMDLRNAMLAYAPNTTVEVQYVRDGAIKKTNVTLKTYVAQAPVQEAPRLDRRGGNPFDGFRRQFPGFGENSPFDLDEDAAAPSEERKVGEPARLGVGINDIDDSTRSRFSLPKGTSGVVIISVDSGSVAAKSGLKPGDVIESVNGKSVTDGRSLKDAIGGIKWGDRAKITTVRYSGGTTIRSTREVQFK